MKQIADNIGILAGKDPVALDTACLDLVQENSKEKLFEKGRISLQHAEKIGLGTMEYKLIEINGEATSPHTDDGISKSLQKQT